MRVLEGAAALKGERLAGFAANASFWADEVRHTLDTIAGYERRAHAWRQAAPASGEGATLSEDDLHRLQKRLTAAATRFFRLLQPHMDRGQTLEIETSLGIVIDHIDHRSMD